jgi:TusA-related sulfurtransferase
MDEADRRAVTGFVTALATRQRSALLDYLDADVRLRAVLPGRDVDRTGAPHVADEVLGWFAEVPHIIALETRVEPIGDLWHVGYRWQLDGLVRNLVVGQQAYCTVRGGRITTIRLVCSGFRPVTRSVRTDTGRSALEALAVDATIEALGEGCATLTPRIAATMRGLHTGAVLAVLTDEPSAPDDIAAWSRLTGHELVGSTAERVGTRHYLRHA